jgi:8-oxo-dGTP pyrophosphatase MutT (NUDIX family)
MEDEKIAGVEAKNPWKTLTNDVVYDNPWISVEHRDVITPTGSEGIYGLVHFKNLAIGVIPIDEHGNTFLIGQFRYPLNRYSWEIPEGGGALDVEPLESAKRELQEETGMTASHWTELQRMDLSNSVTDECAILYLAEGLTSGLSSPDETEVLEVWKLPFEAAFAMMRRGEITDSLSVAAIWNVQYLISQGWKPRAAPRAGQ